MRKGDLIMLDAGVPHKLIVEKESPCRMLNVEFTLQALRRHLPVGQAIVGQRCRIRGVSRARIGTIVLRDPADVRHILKSLVLELDIGRSGKAGKTMTNLLISQLLVRVARLAAEDAKDGAERQITAMCESRPNISISITTAIFRPKTSRRPSICIRYTCSASSRRT